MKILATGGGTLGPVTPLLAILEQWKERDSSLQAVWVGTVAGPEKTLVKEYRLPFYTLPKARLPRYPSSEWVLLPFRFLGAFIKSFYLLLTLRPDWILSAGGYTAVPLVFVGWLLRIPVWIHQSDVEPVLSNKLCAPFARLITCAWKQTVDFFPAHKTFLIGNPVRKCFFEGKRKEANRLWGLHGDKPVALVLGGGTGAQAVNEAMAALGKDLLRTMQVIHVTGKGKLLPVLQNIGSDYHVTSFLGSELAHAYAAADLIVCRAGMGTMSECIALGKPCVLLPLPGQQTVNALALQERTGMSVVLPQDVAASKLLSVILAQLKHQRRFDDSKKMRAVFPVRVPDAFWKQLEEKTST